MFKMEKFEYKVVVFQTGIIRQKKAVDNWEDELNKLGKDGWELVEVIPMVASIGAFGSTPQIRCFLKRRIEK